MFKQLTSSLILASFLLSSCEEEPLPIITVAPIPPLLDSTWQKASPATPDPRVVLFEDFTGVRCVNCPAGHSVIKTMQGNYPGRIVAIGIHPGGNEFPQAAPFQGYENLNTTWGTTIFTIINKPNGIPYGIVDRVQGSVLTSEWNGFVQNRMALPSKANASAKILSFDPDTRELRYEVRFELTSGSSNALYFSTAITEDSIISKQEFSDRDSLYYQHNHVLRNFLQFKELLLPAASSDAAAGRVFLKQFAYTLPQNWKARKCNLAAFIHEDIEVLQAVEIPISW